MINFKVNNEGKEIEELNFLQRFMGIIISPSATMNYLAKKPKIFFGFLSSFLTAVTFYLLRYQLFRDYVKYTTENANPGQAVSITENELSKVIINRFIYAPVASVIWLLIITGLIFGLVKLFKGSGNFKQYLSITGYANVVVIVSFFVYFIVSFFTGKLLFNTSLTGLTNLFASNLRGTYLYGVFKGVDLFGIWYFTVIGIGVILASKLSKTKVIWLITRIKLSLKENRIERNFNQNFKTLDSNFCTCYTIAK